MTKRLKRTSFEALKDYLLQPVPGDYLLRDWNGEKLSADQVTAILLARQRNQPRTESYELCGVIEQFESELQGCWWSAGTCGTSRDASCGPDISGPDADLLTIPKFDNGFHHDAEGSVADSLRTVMEKAIVARAKNRATA